MVSFALVVPARSSEKHPSNPLAAEQRFLNFGALAVATYCEIRGHTAQVFDEYVLGGREFRQVLADSFGEQGPNAQGFRVVSRLQMYMMLLQQHMR